MQREIVMDTETTGLETQGGDRLIEIGCVEIFNRIPTGREFHAFINPDGRAVHPEALAVHGISNALLEDKPRFAEVVNGFLDFIAEDTLVIHNAPFDVGFINMELERLDMPALAMDRVVDTLALARRKHPGGPNTLDALCRRYGIDNSVRTKHGAIVDSLLLAEVYVELLGERQVALDLAGSGLDSALVTASRAGERSTNRPRPKPLPSRLSAEDLVAHEAFIATLGENAIWNRYLSARNPS